MSQSASNTPALLLVTSLLLISCAKKETVSIQRDVDRGGIELNVNAPNGGVVVDPVHGKEVWFGIGPVKGEQGVPVNGMVQIHEMEDGTSLVSMQVNIRPAPAGEEFHGWLVNGAGERIDIGTLGLFAKGVQHRLSYDAKRELRAYSTVQITLRKTGSQETGTLQATGTISERTRNIP